MSKNKWQTPGLDGTSYGPPGRSKDAPRGPSTGNEAKAAAVAREADRQFKAHDRQAKRSK